MRLKERHGGEVVVCSAGPARVSQVIREALARGADRAIHVEADRLSSADGAAVSGVLAAAMREEKFDLVLTGLQSDDQGLAQVGVALAERLGMTHATIIMEVKVEDGALRVKRELEGGWFQWVAMPLPAVLDVIGTAGTERGLELAKSSGAHHVLNHHDPEISQKLSRLTAGKGVQVILEMLANVNLGKDLAYLSKFGRVVVIGSRGPVEINPRETMTRDASILGMTLANATEEELREIHEDLVRGLTEGSLKPVVGKELPLSAAPQAHLDVMAPGAYGKIVLIP